MKWQIIYLSHCFFLHLSGLIKNHERTKEFGLIVNVIYRKRSSTKQLHVHSMGFSRLGI